MSEVTAIEMMDELADILHARGDREQAAFLRGVCDALYGADCEPEGLSDDADKAVDAMRTCGAYVAGHVAGQESGYCV